MFAAACRHETTPPNWRRHAVYAASENSKHAATAERHAARLSLKSADAAVAPPPRSIFRPPRHAHVFSYFRRDRRCLAPFHAGAVVRQSCRHRASHAARLPPDDTRKGQRHGSTAMPPFFVHRRSVFLPIKRGAAGCRTQNASSRCEFDAHQAPVLSPSAALADAERRVDAAAADYSPPMICQPRAVRRHAAVAATPPAFATPRYEREAALLRHAARSAATAARASAEAAPGAQRC